MKKAIFVSSLLLSGLVSASAFASPTVRFSGVCANGDFDASGIEIGYSNLNLDLDESNGKIASAECTITTTLPARHGFRITASDFKLQADALVSDPNGLASVFVNHRFNGQDLNGVSAITRKDGPLRAQQLTIGATGCDKPVELRTVVKVKAKNAIVLQQDALARVVSYKLQYVQCP